MTQRKVLVTGPTGNVGPHAVASLHEAGVDVRAMTLPDDPKANTLPTGVDVVRGDLADPDSVDACLDDVDAVLLMWPFFTLPVDTAATVLDLIRKRVRRIVLVSSIGVHLGLERRDNNCHAYLEELIEDTELEWTFLRTTGFCANTLGWAPQIRADGVVRFPYGAAARSSIDEADLGAVAAAALTGDGHAGARYLVTGPQALTQEEHVHAIGEAIGRSLAWVDVPHGDAREQMVAQGWPPGYADGALDYFAQLVAEPELVTSTVAEILGRPAHTFREWAVEHAAAFR
jgi:uncharacterized protein YbjT (DUF2867 family)